MSGNADWTSAAAREPIARVRIPGIVLGDRIGGGGTADVYEGHEAELGRHVAVKILRGDLTEDGLRRFQREQAIMGRLSGHADIVGVYRAGVTTTGHAFLVMPRLRHSLGDELKRGQRIEVSAAVADMERIARAVHLVHTNGVLHRDIKPANVLRSNTGAPLVTDFGISELIADTRQSDGGVTLTPAYAAPEVLEGAEATVASDVYSLGATLYALLAGCPAFGEQARSLGLWQLAHHLRTVPIPPLPVDIPERVRVAIQRAMNPTSYERFASAQDFALALSHLEGRQPGPTQTITRPPPTSPQVVPPPAPGEGRSQTRQRALLVGVLALVLGGAAALVAVLNRGGGGADPIASDTAVVRAPAEDLAPGGEAPTPAPTTPVPTQTPAPSLDLSPGAVDSPGAPDPSGPLIPTVTARPTATAKPTATPRPTATQGFVNVDGATANGRRAGGAAAYADICRRHPGCLGCRDA